MAIDICTLADKQPPNSSQCTIPGSASTTSGTMMHWLSRHQLDQAYIVPGPLTAHAFAMQNYTFVRPVTPCSFAPQRPNLCTIRSTHYCRNVPSKPSSIVVSCQIQSDTENPSPPPVVTTDSSPAQRESSKPPSESDLLSEQMKAYFASSDTTFQPQLKSTLELGLRNFVIELSELTAFLRRIVGMEAPLRYELPQVLGLKLCNEAVSQREQNREQAKASPIVRFVYQITCKYLDIAFDNRPIQRFWFLETVARMPYFAYSSCLHLYATLGWYRSPTLMNMHHAEELNEAYHLAVMESLGGDKAWVVSNLSHSFPNNARCTEHPPFILMLTSDIFNSLL